MQAAATSGTTAAGGAGVQMVSDNDMFKAAAAKPKTSTLRLGLNVPKKVSCGGELRVEQYLWKMHV
jgi:hypothetical protein